MPLQSETIRFDEELDRLNSEREQLAEQLAGLESGNPAAKQLARDGQQLDTFRDGVRWALDHATSDDSVSVWSDDVDSVTLSGLTGGEFGRVEDRLLDAGGSGPQPGATRVHQVAAGTVEAPYYNESADRSQNVAAASQLPISFLKWAEHRIDDLTSVDSGNGKSFADLVQEKQAAASTEE